MESALQPTHLKAAPTKLVLPLGETYAFLMLGGASLIAFLVLQSLTLRDVAMMPIARELLQQVRSSGMAFALIFSFPHFIWSFRFAYQQGGAFVLRHPIKLVVLPVLLLSVICFAAASWTVPVSTVPLLSTIELSLQNLGVNTAWHRYSSCGQLIFANLLVCQLVIAGQHYTMQSFGVALSGAETAGYVISSSQKRLMRLNLYCLWIMNLFSGYTFFSALNHQSFAYHPFSFPQPLCMASNVVFFSTCTALLYHLVLAKFRSDKQLPPSRAVVPIISVWLWLQPFWQPFGYQAWVVPLAHGAQYIFFACRVENNNFAARPAQMHDVWEKRLFTLFIAISATVIGYGAFVWLPGTVSANVHNASLDSSFFAIATFLFLSLHHYVVDTVVWKSDSKPHRLLHL